MADTVNKQTRSKMMSSVRAKNTKLEVDIRRRLFTKGFRYRLNVHDLPGTPDIVFPKYSAVVFINGCFWHFHSCSRATAPQNRREWWKKKLQDNKARDEKVITELLHKGWRVLIIWECSVRRPGLNRDEALGSVCFQITEFLHSNLNFLEISGPLL